MHYLIPILIASIATHAAAEPTPPPEKTVVLTFDDAVKSHRTLVGPLLKDLGFGATFYVTQRWMDDTENFMTWQDIAELHEMGFEIGNHSWTHAAFNTPESAEKLRTELKQVEDALARVGVPTPTTFAWCGNAFGPESLNVLQEAGYQFARRGMQPELPYGEIHLGPAYDATKHHPLLIPTTGDAYPEWTLGHFKKVVAEAKDGKIVVLQFHGVPDEAHPWVHTPPDMFEQYMRYLKANDFTCIPLRDVAPYVDRESAANDPMKTKRYPTPEK